MDECGISGVLNKEETLIGILSDSGTMSGEVQTEASLVGEVGLPHCHYLDVEVNGESVVHGCVAEIDLTPYALEDEIFSGDYNDLTNKPTIPTKTSDLTNDNNFISSETDPIFTASDAYGISATDIANWNGKADASDIPTKVSDLTNDSGFITDYIETDPIFSASPASGITANDISDWNNKSDFSGSYDDLTDKPTIPTVPSNVSAFTNDAGYITLADLPIYDGGVL